MIRNSILAIFAVLALGLTSGCSILSSLFPEDHSPRQVDPAVSATYFGEPTVRPGLVLGITVTAAGTPAYEPRQYQVDTEGRIMLPLIGAVKCTGLTLVGLSEKITGLYKEYLQDPQVSAVYVYQPNMGMISPWGTVIVLGEVNRPGPVDVPSTQDLTVTKALYLAGGATQLADNRRVKVTSCDSKGTQTQTRVNLVEIGEQGRADKDLRLKAGDVVWVPISLY